jgi:hypothetical protein
MTKARSNAVANAAKGDLTVGNGTNLSGILAAGSNGDTLVADSSTATGLSYQANFAAGKNKIINGDFFVNQRNFTSVSSISYGFDRWIYAPSGATGTYTPQTFTLGTAPVAGYEGKNFARLTVTTGNDFARLTQFIESVRTFAGQTATLSFWAKGTNPTTAGNLKVSLTQYFGTGGSPSANVDVTEQTFVLTANWTRYSFTFSVPSISGKTIGTDNNDYLAVNLGQGTSASSDAWTLDLWGVQLEAGSVATAFQTATGTIQGELAACQRYYERWTPGTSNFAFAGFNNSTTSAYHTWHYQVRKRVSATVSVSAAGDFSVRTPAGNQTCSAFSTIGQTIDGTWINTTSVSLGSGDGNFLVNTGVSPFIQADAEL